MTAHLTSSLAAWNFADLASSCSALLRRLGKATAYRRLCAGCVPATRFRFDGLKNVHLTRAPIPHPTQHVLPIDEHPLTFDGLSAAAFARWRWAGAIDHPEAMFLANEDSARRYRTAAATLAEFHGSSFTPDTIV